MYRLIIFLYTLPLFSQELLISYFNQNTYDEQNITLPSLSDYVATTDVTKICMISLSGPLNNGSNALSIYGGSSVARWDIGGDYNYAYATYLSTRLSPVSILFFCPYIEASIGGPTYLAKNIIGDKELCSKLLYQNYISVGIKFTAFIVDLRVINYSQSLGEILSEDSITMPLILSLGCSF